LHLTGAHADGKESVRLTLGKPRASTASGVECDSSHLRRRTLHQARAGGTHGRLLKRLAKAELLILDDWGLAPMTPEQRRDLLEVLDERCGRAATIVTSQFPVELGHGLIDEATVADAILDRLIHGAYRGDPAT